jgi:hypothetical protein
MNTSLILENLASKLHNSNNRYITHQELSDEFKNLYSDMNFIHQAIKDHIINPNIFKNANNLFFYLHISGDVIIAINLFPPIADKAESITHDNIHHHGWRLLTTGVISGDGYDTITFCKNSHKDITNSVVNLKVEEIYRHTKLQTKFINSYQPHVVFHPASTTATLALWSSEKPLLNQKIKKYLKNFSLVGKVLSKVARISKLDKTLGLNSTNGIYFHPENGKIIETKNYSKPIDGTRDEILHCMFRFFQQINLNDTEFFNKIKKNSLPKTQKLCEMLMSNEPIPDYGIKGNIRRRFSKSEILKSLS